MGKLSKLKKLFFVGLFVTAAAETAYLVKNSSKKVQAKVETLKQSYESYGSSKKKGSKKAKKKTTRKK